MKELVLDTNIFIRYLIEDISFQYKESRKIFEAIENGTLKGLVSILVVNETIWILENYYEIKRSVYIPKLLQIFALKNLKIIEIAKEVLSLILKSMEASRLDFTDLYLLHTSKKEKIASFDKDLKSFNTTTLSFIAKK